MKISLEDYKNLVPSSGILLPAVEHNRIQRFFCVPNTLNGNCTTACHSCQPFLQQVLQELSDAREVRDPAAFLVWLLRDASAKMAEKPHVARTPTDCWGLPTECNPFVLLQEQL